MQMSTTCLQMPCGVGRLLAFARAFIVRVTGSPYLNPLSSLLLTILLHLTMPSVVLAARHAPVARAQEMIRPSGARERDWPGFVSES
ncbi:hypothetical protein BHE74_00024679 [Ensete ventricosum]|nr:hypothetical protein BHE74_00024679 [Ensete ventricosum]